MVDALMMYEMIDSDQIDDIMSGNTPRRPASDKDDDGDSGETTKQNKFNK